MNPRGNHQRVKDILQAIDSVYDLRRLLIKYEHEELLESVAYSALSYNLIIIGEAVKHLTDDFKSSNPSNVWEQSVEWRNELAHQYFSVNLGTVEEIIEGTLSELAEILER